MDRLFLPDQAYGLRLMQQRVKPDIVSFLSTLAPQETASLLFNLGSVLAYAGHQVLLLDARCENQGVASLLAKPKRYTLLEASRQECALNQLVRELLPGLGLVQLASRPLKSSSMLNVALKRLEKSFEVLRRSYDVILIDARLDCEDALPLPSLNTKEVVVLCSPEPESIKDAYLQIKRLHWQLGRRAYSVVVCNSNQDDGMHVFENLASVAEQHLAIPLEFLGILPLDPSLQRADKLGRSLSEAFPMAPATQALRSVGQKLMGKSSMHMLDSEAYFKMAGA